MLKLTVKNRIGDVSDALRSELRRVVGEAAADVEGRAKLAAPVDTGNLKNSISHEQTDDLTAVVSVGAEYGIHVEMGTVHQPGQPFLTPALEDAREVFAGAVADALRRASA
jgi:HK97 gp10 family phage protein